MDFLNFVRTLAKRDAPPTSAELRRALADAEAAASAGHAKCAQLAIERGNILLDATDAALDRVERALQLAQRDADRADVAAAALRERVADAEAAERQAELDEAHARGQAAYRRCVELIVNEYAPQAVALAAVLAELVEHYAVIRGVNEVLARADDGRIIKDPDFEARPRSNFAFLPLSLVDSVKLPATEDASRCLWPDNLDMNGISDPRPRPKR